ncbi:YheU family protein [Candidatus Magnetaquicoccus inordinatus]|uniref:YheU family protein n=1 Tax=Candidatus Magnetaquicoccus inordinatus TaxID=2496818 RepID=UPI00187D2422|nr:YheU family protein [Candidatus Magnetaquicoccus inordinatus]
MIVVPADRLSPAALQSVIEDFITVQMPEDWSAEEPVATKVAQIKTMISRGLIEIRFDPQTQSCGLFEKVEI